MSTMETQQKPTTWEDVLRMPDDGNRYEFIGGRLYVTAAPVIRHQRISKRLVAALMRILEDAGHGEVFKAPCLVEFPGIGDRVQPDLFFVAEERREIIREKQLLGAHSDDSDHRFRRFSITGSGDFDHRFRRIPIALGEARSTAVLGGRVYGVEV